MAVRLMAFTVVVRLLAFKVTMKLGKGGWEKDELKHQILTVLTKIQLAFLNKCFSNYYKPLVNF